MKSLKLYTDGGSRGNPGPSAGAFVICDLEDNVVEKTGFFIGSGTNNIAEYTALSRGLAHCQKLGAEQLSVHLDSELVVRQLNGEYKVKNAQLKPLYEQVKKLAQGFRQIEFKHVPREQNHLADTELNRVLDENSR